MGNPDNAGLLLPINVLNNIVRTYEVQGLSRTDIWMLSAIVAANVAETEIGLEFPFQWIGRQTCDEVHQGNCGVQEFNGDDDDSAPSSCTSTTGPPRELCHGTSGTTTILDFFDEEFGFNPQQVAAIMGAHTIGRMRRENLGFDAPAGWDLTNNQLDHGYYAELVGAGDDPIEDTPDWRLTFVENNDLNGIPRRPQWEAEVNGRRLVMLHSDMAMVRQLDVKEDGSVDCDFKGGGQQNNQCPEATATMPHMIRYRRSLEAFVVDFREVLDLMISNGYHKLGDCLRDQVCQLLLAD
jgi:hypothetical protein